MSDVDIPHPAVALEKFNSEFRSVEVVGPWLVYFTGLQWSGAGHVCGAWIASRPKSSETDLERLFEHVGSVFGRQIASEDLLTRHGRHEVRHKVIDAKDKLIAKVKSHAAD